MVEMFLKLLIFHVFLSLKHTESLVCLKRSKQRTPHRALVSVSENIFQVMFAELQAFLSSKQSTQRILSFSGVDFTTPEIFHL